MKNFEEPVPTFKVELGNASEVLDAFSVPTTAEPLATMDAMPVPEPPLNLEAKVPAIAVLPFANMSGDPEQDYFVDGITEDIITNLSLWRTFPVISRNSSFTYRGKSSNLKQVAEELRVRYIVDGSVRNGGQPSTDHRITH